MSGGPNQHYLPRLLQKPFAIPPKRKEIWVFARGAQPEPKTIKEVGSGEYFYSEPSSDGSRTLDDDITDIETPVSRILADIRSAPLGAQVNSTNAAEIVNHLVPRTAHVRVSMERGLRMMGHGVETILSDTRRFQDLIGLNEDKPNEVFRQTLAEKFDEIEGLENLGLPRSLIERVAFFLAKENFTTLAADFMPTFRTVLKNWFDTSDIFVRDGHNKALRQLFNSTTPRLKLYEELNWTVIAAPKEGAILPDCVALAVDRSGLAGPAMFANWDELAAIILPVAPNKLLIGITPYCESTQLPDFNEEAARSSHDFFLGPLNNKYFESLHKRLGERSMQLIEEGVSCALEPYLAMESNLRDQVVPMLPLDIVGQSDDPWQYELSLLGCGDNDDIQELTSTIQSVVRSLAQAIPLHRLDGITVASDYRAAVLSLDRGYEGASAPETAPKEIGQGIARTISVHRNRCWKERIVIDARAALSLLADESDTVEWGVYILVRQLAEVAIIEMIDRHLPGVWMQPIADPLQGFLYTNVHPAILGYLSSHLSAGFCDQPVHTEMKRELFISAVREMKSAGLAARLEYRYHGNVDRLLAIAMPHISYVLQFGADLLGDCAASGVDPFDSGGELAQALDTTGLRHWFPIFGDHLERLRVRLGQWDSFDEFLALNIHVERLMWQLGMLPWFGPEGIRVDVPLGTDIEALLAAKGNC